MSKTAFSLSRGERGLATIFFFFFDCYTTAPGMNAIRQRLGDRCTVQVFSDQRTPVNVNLPNLYVLITFHRSRKQFGE